MSTINEAAVLRFYLDTQEYSDRLTAIEAQAASNLATQKSEVAAAIAQVNLTQSQTITALTLEVNNLKTNLIDSITATQTELIDRADQLAQDVTDITVQLTQDKATFTQEIQDALDYLKDDASVASALRTPRKIQGVDFDGTQDINLPTFTSETDGLVPKRVGATSTKYLREDGTWVVPSDTAYALLTKASAEDGTATAANTISAQVLKEAIQYHAPTVTNIVGNAETATKLATARAINDVNFDGSTNITIADNTKLPLSGGTVSGNLNARALGINSTDGSGAGLSLYGGASNGMPEYGIAFALTQDYGTHGSVYGDWATYFTMTRDSNRGWIFRSSTHGNVASISAQGVITAPTFSGALSGNAATATKLQTARTISLTGNVTGSVNFDGSANAAITTAITGLGVANGIATLDSSGQVPSTQLPSYVDDVLEYTNVAAFPATGETGKIYVETAGNITYRWSGTGYVKITSGEVSSVAGKTGVVNLSKADVGLPNVDDTADSSKSVASATKLTTARTIGGVSFDGTDNISLPGVNTAGNQNTSGNAATAAKLQTPRSIAISGAVTGTATSFDGSSDIAIATTAIDGSQISTGTIPEARIPTLNQSTTGNAGSATKLQTARLINGIAFDGTGDINLDVYSKAETNSIAGTPIATETVEGKAKIATTAIAKEGINDTDFITAKKLRDALNASGNAPVSACRAWLSVNGSTATIISSFNIASFTRVATGQYKITFTTPMPHADYVAFTNSIGIKGAGAGSNTIGCTFDATKTNTVSECYVWCWSTAYGIFGDVQLLNIGVFC